MKGIDVSAYQGLVPWHKLEDVHFGMVKVTEGEGYTNPYWKDNAVNLHVEQLIRGFYLFSLPGQSRNTPEAEAAYMWSKIESLVTKGDLLAVDIEKTNFTNALLVCDWVYRVADHLEYLAGWRPFIYSYPDFINKYLSHDKRLSRFPLWLAWYQAELPHSFAQWPTIALWQQGPGKVGGMMGQVDIDVFFLTAKDLSAYGRP